MLITYNTFTIVTTVHIYHIYILYFHTVCLINRSLKDAVLWEGAESRVGLVERGFCPGSCWRRRRRERGSLRENHREPNRQRQRLKESSLPQAFNHETHKEQETAKSHGSPPFCQDPKHIAAPVRTHIQTQTHVDGIKHHAHTHTHA